MPVRDESASAMRPTSEGLCVVMVCTDLREADEVGRLLLEPNNGYLVTYRRVEHLMLNAPARRPVSVILASKDDILTTGRALNWLRNRWPHCPVTVVGDEGGGAYERTVRAGGANYLTRPVTPEQWRATLALVGKGTAGQLTGT